MTTGREISRFAPVRWLSAALASFPGPLFWHELRYGFVRNPATGWTMSILGTVFAAVFLVAVQWQFSAVSELEDPPGRSIFLLETVLLLIYVIVAAPMFSARAFIADKDRRTFDLVMSSGLSGFQILAGKLSAAWVRTLAGLFTAAPAVLATIAMGGVAWIELPKHLLFFGGLAAAACTVATVLSLFLRSAVLCTVLTQMMLAYVLIGTVFLSLIAWAIFNQSLGVGYPRFWVILTVINGLITVITGFGGIVLFNRLSQWDY